jgi:Glycosyltransferase family 92
MSYLSICAIYRDEASYLREWIEFHRLVGADRFYLYDNLSSDDHEQVLAPYVETGLVSITSWSQTPGQTLAYDDCLERHREDSRWIAFIDVDEFLFSPSGRPLPEILPDYEGAPAVAVNWVTFGTSGHRTAPPGLVIENYLERSTEPSRQTFVKHIADPRRTVRCVTPHRFLYEDGFAVTEKHEPLDRPPYGRTDTVSLSRLRINHYYTRSQEEWSRKLDEREPSFGMRRRGYDRRAGRGETFDDERDETITIYLPALRDALARG